LPNSSSLAARLRHIFARYPRQFWLMFFGMLLSTTGASMIWPFQMIYITEKLNVELAVVTMLVPFQSLSGITASFIAGPIIDRTGRKGVMALSLVLHGLTFVLLSQATTLWQFGVLLAMIGIFNPLYRSASDAMMADLVPPKDRVDAYSMLRMSNNLGVAIGPAVGGFIATRSYTLAFLFAATGMIIYGLMIAFLARETLPAKTSGALQPAHATHGYGPVFKDSHFLLFTLAFTFTSICATLIWVLMGYYAKNNYQIPESQYGWIATTNALMVVFFQVWVTNRAKRFPPLRVITAGAVFYTIGAGSVALATGFWGFWASMVVMTVGELIFMPTSTTYVANMAPSDMRGRYMSLFGLSWNVASGVGTPFGGFLNRQLGPRSIWYGGGLIGVFSVIGFLLLQRFSRRRELIETSAPHRSQ